MPAKPNSRNWNDVQTVIATTAIVTTLGLWNLFAAPAKKAAIEEQMPVIPTTEPPLSSEVETAQMPQVKIIFTPMASQIAPAQQQQTEVKKKKKKNNNNSGPSVTQTRSS